MTDDAPARTELRYEGKAKRVYATSDPELYRVEYKDDATAYNAAKRGTIAGKGEMNAAITATLMRHLEAEGIRTHFVAQLGPREQLVRRVEIVPVEVIVRNRAAGSFAARYGVEEGPALDPIVIEWCLKSDELGDPPMNDATAVALGFASEDELEALFEGAIAVNEALRSFFEERGLDLVDFKLEFGTDADGRLLLADEISPDTCRLWDLESGERLDKDRFRRDLGGVEEAYREVTRRVVDEASA
ncbi:MAG: phosphoribosylaminoimidazolesuccinocarboxamide synthase [Trueperaceae bacterium]|nr:phosphoribosylaminoimidazolesuccinocarboxamide synthase [Trueperaceae bacterium]